MPTYGVGNIFTIGLTAALAWELPHEPIDLKKLKSGTNDAEKRIDHRNNQTKISFHNPFIQKYPHQYITNDWVKQTNKKHENYFGELLPAYRNEYLYRKHGQVHRRTRRELFAKIEKFFQAQDKDGRACLLKSICEVNQKKTSEKGSFVEEILKAIFTWVPGEENKMDHELFDEASGHKGNCTEKYPTCRQSVWNPFF